MDEPFRSGQQVTVRLPAGVSGWERGDGAKWNAVVVYVNGDSIDVCDAAGVIEPVDREFVHPRAIRTRRSRKA